MSTSKPPSEARTGRFLAGGLALLVLAFGVVGWLAGWHLGADSAVYRAGALTLLHGDPLYTRDVLTALPDWVRLPFTYTPAAAPLFLPLALVPSGLVWGVIAFLSVVGLMVVITVVSSSPGGAPLLGRSRWALPAGTAIALGLEPVWKTLFLGQINLILMAFVVLDVLVLSQRESRWAGVLIGVAAAIKLTPLIFVPHLFFTGRWKDGLRALGTFAALEAAMFAVIPVDAVRFWRDSATDPTRVGSVHWIFNQSLNGLVNRASALAPWSLAVAVGVAAVLAVPSVWLVVRLHRRGEEAAALLVTAFYGLLLSPVSWSHHWVWCVPLLTLLVVKARWWAAAAVALLFVSQIVMLVPNGGDREFGWGLGWSVLGNLYVLAAAAGILGLAARELRLVRRSPQVVTV
ncbi:transmembrane protein [Amycolatopsis mediterranei S699]|uniref:Transmembrane protein n=2 Tax=Amycolatopsis mediterranei TaxID=33910 RepID=A0A9R0NRX1_AMYMS|nr:glycosyltransferase 87 family protein [Amycolatopsis mediterranei]ADJ42809.1 putative transmembrane protein [Amycolatopsis mediterranei U32]AEK39501.1 transmembrane protein [Amycolatopsis mediterranei S699]AFO74523.1 transmembrane protein [Amycolatopsis mediterranei S699]AGT81652.1 transmembrane protein [Amycolatopsis mediterranei RB]KDO09891.1 membrane protein [Amycolatopsis mediterranei]